MRIGRVSSCTLTLSQVAGALDDGLLGEPEIIRLWNTLDKKGSRLREPTWRGPAAHFCPFSL